MNTFAQKSRNNQDKASADGFSNVQSGDQIALQPGDSHPSVIAQRTLQEKMNQSPNVQSQLKLQQSLNQSPRVVAQMKLAETLSGRKPILQPKQIIQRQESLEEEEPLTTQMEADPMQREAMPEDEEEEPLQTKLDPIQREEMAEEEEPLQGRFEPAQRQENKTGLSDQLKAGVESLSGMSMDDVRVHYDSAKPAQLNALAYTQGTDIHVAAGQEKHLAHEAWHAVQQKQGRVRPTVQMRGTAINDDTALEREADLMGKEAAQLQGAAQMQRGGGAFADTIESGSRLAQVIQGHSLSVIQLVARTKAQVLNWRNVYDVIIETLEGNPGISAVIRQNATRWQVTLSHALNRVVWTIDFTFNQPPPFTVDQHNRVLTINFNDPAASPNINDEDDQWVFAHESAQRIDDLITQQILNPLDNNMQVGGIFRADINDTDPAHINQIDRLKIDRLRDIAGQYLTDYNNLNAAPANGGLRVTANRTFQRLSAQVQLMALGTPGKLAALNRQNVEDIPADRLKVINSVAKQQEFQAYEAQVGNLGHANIITHETVGHLINPEERNTADEFRMMGIGGGHDDQALQDFVAASNGRYRIERIFQQQVNWHGQQMTLRMYDQYLRNNNGWVKSDVKKSTTDNMNLMLYSGKAALANWLNAPNAMPGHGQSFGRFSGSNAPEMRDANTGVSFGGYGTRGLLSNQNEVRTLFVSDEFFFDRMAEDIRYLMPDEPDRDKIIAAFKNQSPQRRTQILQSLRQQPVTEGFTDYDNKVATMKLRLTALKAFWEQVSQVASQVDNKLKSNKPGAKNYNTTLDLTSVRNVDPAMATRFQAVEQQVNVSSSDSKRLHSLKKQVDDLRVRYKLLVERAEAQRDIVNSLNTWDQQNQPQPQVAAAAQGGGWRCYITTACMRSRGLPDDCEELTVLRRFRDEYLRRLEGGEELVQMYYRHAPAIVQAIERQENAGDEYERLYGIIRYCVDEVLAGRNETALACYIRMVTDLNSKYRGPIQVPPVGEILAKEAA